MNMRCIMNKLILIKYGELTTKKANRKVFINMLEKNIKNILKDTKTGFGCIFKHMII